MGSRNARATVVLIAGILLLSCNIFSPRDPEYPDPVQVPLPDYFNFRGILATTRIQFRSVEYDDLFNDTLHYTDAMGSAFFKKEIIGHLDKIIAGIESKSFSLVVRWDTLPGNKENFYEETRNSILRRYSYTLTYRQISTDSINGIDGEVISEVHEGTARFELTYARLRNMWTIIFWKDVPDNVSQSIFHPDYNEGPFE